MEESSACGGQKSLRQPPLNARQVVEAAEVPRLDRGDPRMEDFFCLDP